ncbi:MAG: pilin [Candidatus Altiarchaeota archaeon]|nr:pilin [Candidatus Altiarchaeota archaeon]
MEKKALIVLLLASLVSFGYSDPIDFLLDSFESSLVPEIAAPTHCSVRCTEAGGEDRILYCAGEGLLRCFQAAGSLCGGYTDCGKSGEECVSCCSTYCSERGINAYLSSLTSPPELATINSVIARCEKSCRSACAQNANIHSIIELIRNSVIIIAALILAFCGFKFILSTSPYSRDQAKKCIIMVLIALLILGLAFPGVDLFYKPTEEKPEIDPYIDVLKAEHSVPDGLGERSILYLKYRSGWLPEGGELHDVWLNITCLEKRIDLPWGDPCKTSDEVYIGNMGAGEIREYPKSEFCPGCFNFRANFSSSEGSWTYDFICDKGKSNKCHIVRMRVSGPGSGGGPTTTTPPPECSTYTNREECEAGGLCWWDGNPIGAGECKPCELIEKCTDYPVRDLDEEPDDEWMYEGGVCPLCMRNPCKINGECTLGTDYFFKHDFTRCPLCTGYWYWRFTPYKCFSCDDIVKCCPDLRDGVDECSDYEIPSSCQCDTCLKNECWTGDHVDIRATPKSGTPVQEGSSLTLTCADLTVTGEFVAVDGRTAIFRITREALEELEGRGCRVNVL